MQNKLSKNAIILIVDKLRNAINVKTDTELADFLGVKQNTISSWKSRGAIDFQLIISKCDNIDLNWLFDEKSKEVNYFQYENSNKRVQTDSTHDCSRNCTQTKIPKNVYKQQDTKGSIPKRRGVKYDLDSSGYDVMAEPEHVFDSAENSTDNSADETSEIKGNYLSSMTDEEVDELIAGKFEDVILKMIEEGRLYPAFMIEEKDEKILQLQRQLWEIQSKLTALAPQSGVYASAAKTTIKKASK